MVEPSSDRPSNRQGFQIAIICALKTEHNTISLIFDEFWDKEGDRYGRAEGDTNSYKTGRIGNHNAVLLLLPNMGIAAAAGAAACIRSSFPNLKLTFLTGVCGGVPGTDENEALLGDVVICKTLVHGLSKQYPGELVAKETVDDCLSRPTKYIRTLIASFETERGRKDLQEKAGHHLKELQKAAVRQARRYDYRYPGVAEDQLFNATYQHKHHGSQSCADCSKGSDDICALATQKSCSDLLCDKTQLVPRKGLEAKGGLPPDDMQCPKIIIGRMASGDTVMKSAKHRDQIASQRDVVAFEMEGAGAWDEMPCIIIKGICDYADSHKNKKWQPFAAATAAAVTKAVLGWYVPTESS